MEGKRKILATCDKMAIKKVANENFEGKNERKYCPCKSLQGQLMTIRF